MTFLARRTSLAVVLLLLTSLGTASAECAWVLWATMTTGWTGDPSISPSVATKTQRECEMVLRRPVTGHGKGLDKTFNAEAGYVATWRAAPPRPSGEEPMMVQSFTCLPDTVDPRGPKGAVR